MALVYGLDIADLPDGWTPLDAVVVLRCIDDQGRDTAAMRTTDGLNTWETIGLLTVAQRELTLAHQWEDED